jgi:RHS repeat-associated protein
MFRLIYHRILLSVLATTIFVAANGQATSNKPVTGPQIPAAITIDTRPADYAPGSKVNYVRTHETMAPISDETAIDNYFFFPLIINNAVRESTIYVDGLGRPIQTVQRMSTTDNMANGILKDLITPVTYDAFGRETHKYLPYNAYTSNGNFQTNPFSTQDDFYHTSAVINNKGIEGENVFYGKTVYEASPLNKVEKTFAPGNSWAGSENPANPAAEKATRMIDLANIAADAVRVWNIAYSPLTYTNNDQATNIPLSSTTYPAGTLYKDVTIDENGNATVAYKDKEGQVVLKKQQVGAIPADYSGQDASWLCTYYVYDDLNQLRFLVPPKAVAAIRTNWTIGADVVNELCFRYEYDNQARMTARKVPGAGWEYMIYDKRDRLVYKQDANLRSNGRWEATLYDHLNRSVMTGLITYSGTPQSLQDYVDQQTANGNASVNAKLPLSATLYINERVVGTSAYQASENIIINGEFESEVGAEITAEILNGTEPTEQVTIMGDPLPSGNNFIALTITYYDNYDWNSGSNKQFTNADNSKLNSVTSETVLGRYLDDVPAAASIQTQGLVTGKKVRVLDNPANPGQGNWLATVNYYDNKGRVIQAQSDNHKGGVDIITNRYDFVDMVNITYAVHANPAAGNDRIRVRTTRIYNEFNLQIELRQQLNDEGPDKTISRMVYGPRGKMQRKLLSGYSWNFQITDYYYNIRDWTTGINSYYGDPSQQPWNPVPDNAMWFGEELSYNWGFDKNQYNGNIAGVKWRSRGDGEKRAFGFGYDKMNRLLYADFNQVFGISWAKNDPSNPAYAIDFSVKMGDGEDPNSAYDENGNIKAMKQYGLKLTTSDLIDDLTYNYSYNGSANTNKLLNVIDARNDVNTKLGDFRTSALHPQQSKTVATVDYTYDASGNVTKDLNKDIGNSSVGGIEYNHLDLPYRITVYNAAGVRGTITYIYDAEGDKLEKIVKEGTLPEKRTSYIAGFEYENDKLQFFPHDEGRVRLKETTVNNLPVKEFVYDYFLRDHLGNVRMVLTDESRTDIYPVASLESSNAVALENTYYSINAANIVARSQALGIPDYLNSNGIPANNPAVNEAANSSKLYRLNGNNAGSKMGLGITLKVMAGDTISIFGKSYWKTAAGTGVPGSPSAIVLLDLLNGFVGAGVPGGKAVTGSQLNGLSDVAGGIGSLLGQQSQTSTRPKAYINWILFDENFRPVVSSANSNSGADPVGAEGILTSHIRNTGEITKNGYLYIYCSNESQVDVFFDNLQVVHSRGRLLEETHYYPFGLTMAAISSKAVGSIENRKKYNGIEFENDLDVNIYDAYYRELDPQLGRWWQVDPQTDNMEQWSPYASNYNNPLLYSDPMGDWPEWLDKVADVGAAFVGGVVDGAVGTVKGVINVVAHPIETVKGIAHAVANPRETLTNIKNGVVQVVETIKSGDAKAIARGLGQIVGSTLAGGAIAKGASVAGSLVGKVLPKVANKVEAVVKRLSGGCGCFVENTAISTNKGSVPIQLIKVGDTVRAYNVKTGKLENRQVVNVFRHQRDTLYTLSIGDYNIETTSDHPFFINGIWKKVIELKAGDNVQLANGHEEVIKSIRYDVKSVTVYNFEVEQVHTYFVSPLQVLVHNSTACNVATRTESGVKVGKSISEKKAIQMVQAGKDVIVASRKLANSIAKRAFNGKPMKHTGHTLKNGTTGLDHVHPKQHINSSHIFYK